MPLATPWSVVVCGSRVSGLFAFVPGTIHLQLLVSRSGLRPATDARFKYPSAAIPARERLEPAVSGPIHLERHIGQVASVPLFRIPDTVFSIRHPPTALRSRASTYTAVSILCGDSFRRSRRSSVWLPHCRACPRSRSGNRSPRSASCASSRWNYYCWTRRPCQWRGRTPHAHAGSPCHSAHVEHLQRLLAIRSLEEL